MFALETEDEDESPFWSQVLDIGDRAHEMRLHGMESANQRISSLSSSTKETASSLWGYLNNAFDIFGIVAATMFTLLVIPVLYSLVYGNKAGYGLPPERNLKT